jgi:hypothetical protein
MDTTLRWSIAAVASKLLQTSIIRKEDAVVV